MMITINFSNTAADTTVGAFVGAQMPQCLLSAGDPRNAASGRRKRRYNNKQDAAASAGTAQAVEPLNKTMVARCRACLNEELVNRFVSTSRIDFTDSCLTIELAREPLILGGRYCKYSRVLPQSPWFDADHQGTRRLEGSICETIADPLLTEVRADSYKFTSSGREDVDVRMLGDGRPFAIQFTNARITKMCDSATELERLMALVNSASTDVRINSLQRVSKIEFDQLKVGEEDKQKTYTALCWSEDPLTDAMLARLNGRLADGCAPLQLEQKTPIRVLARRGSAVRQRTILELHAVRIDEHYFMLRLRTQAGTYVKEFVHGDFGRTTPSVGEVMETEGDCDILELDVENVHLDWPPPPLADASGV